MPGYAWSCHVCGAKAGAGLGACPTCGAPAEMSGLPLNGVLAYLIGYWIGRWRTI